MNKSTTYFLQGMCFLILAQIMVGVNIVASKYVLSSIPILFILALRFTLAAIILFLHWLTPAKTSMSYYFSRLKQKIGFYNRTSPFCRSAF